MTSRFDADQVLTQREDGEMEWPQPHVKVMGAMAERHPARVGRYRLMGAIGQGAMGTVYRAFDPDLEREVAIKLVRGVSTEKARARLLREARALARFGHPNLIQVFDVGIEDGLMYVVMEYRPGHNLKTWLGQEQRDWHAVLDVFLQAGRGLQAMHAVGLGHRDFKPQNVLLGDDGSARILDFGLAKAFSDAAGDTAPAASLSGAYARVTEVTQEGTVLGTPAYMAPELWCRGRTEPRSDQFAFCVALYEALYGRRPFAGDKLRDLGTNIVQGRVLPPPEGSAVPGRLWPVIRRGLARTPGKRFASMYALLRELERAKLRIELDEEAHAALMAEVGPRPDSGVWDIDDAAEPLIEFG